MRNAQGAFPACKLDKITTEDESEVEDQDEDLDTRTMKHGEADGGRSRFGSVARVVSHGLLYVW